MPGFSLNKALLNEADKNEILSSLSAISSISGDSQAGTIDKLSSFFDRKAIEWVEADFSRWGMKAHDTELFSIIKNALLNNRIINFSYIKYYGECSEREVAPLKLIFKNRSWYLYSFCRHGNGHRLFKLSRMHDVVVNAEIFRREELAGEDYDDSYVDYSYISVRAYADKSALGRLREDAGIMPADNGDGSYSFNAPDAEWLIEYFISYGSSLVIIEPGSLRNKISLCLREMIEKYAAYPNS